MQLKRTHVFGRSLPVAVLAGVMSFSPALAPVAAYADTASSQQLKSQLDAAQKELDSLSRDLEIAQAKYEQTAAELQDTRDQIAKLKEQIAQKKKEVASKQQSLSKSVSSSYKQGGTSIVELIMASNDFSELISQVFYANKVADEHNSQIKEVSELVKSLNEQEQTLSKKESELSRLAEEQKQTKASFEAQQRKTESYVNGLSVDLQKALAEERAEAARKAQEEAARNAAAAAGDAGRADSGTAGTAGNAATRPSTGSGGSASSGGSGSAGAGAASGNLSSSARNTIIAAAKSQLGVRYSLGASQPGVAMDCSGLTSYAYRQAGISIARSSRAQYSQVRARGNLKTSTGALTPGDLVFYQAGGVIYHVAIYIGGGQVCHANGYGQGVVISGVTYDDGFCGGGSPV